MTSERVIRDASCVAEGTDWLAARVPQFADALAISGPPPLRLRPDGFAALAEAITGQQVSVAAAAAIGGRLRAAGFHEPAAVRRADPEALRACGLSRPKTRYLMALAEADLDYAALRTRTSQEVIAQLVAIPGIGRWTAEIYALFALGRSDILPAGDLALQEAARLVFGLEARPTEGALRAMGRDWQPWRGVAARLLWAYYRAAKGREGTT